jgi:YVTN family beta-propeller protein
MKLRIACCLGLVGLATSSVSAGTSNSLLDVSPDGTMLLAANRDNGTVTVVDTASRKVLREIKVGAKPEGVSWIAAGPRAVVTLYEDNALVFFDAVTGMITKTLPVSAEPYGIVADPGGNTGWVTHEYPGTISTVDLQKEAVVHETKAGSHLRGIALSPDCKRIYVSEFYTGALLAFDVAGQKVADSWKGHSTDNLCRHVLLHPTRPKAYLAHIRSMVAVNNGSGSIFPQLSICDLKPGADKRRVSFGMDTFNGVYVTTNPWESAMSSDGKRFYLLYAGTDDINLCRVIDDDYREIVAMGLPRQIGHNPRAIRLSPDNQLVYIYNAMDFAVGVYQADTMKLVDSIKVCAPPMTPEWVRGKVLFNSAKPPMTSRRWIACSSCHPDGHHDSRVWQQPEGLRKTTALFGVAHTHPLHWSADRDEVQDFEYTIRSQLMQSYSGLAPGPFKRKVGFEKVELTEKTAGRSKDLDALAIYTNSFEFPLSPHVLGPGKLRPPAVRGKEIFFRADVGCASCHSGAYYTDSSLEKPFKLHDVGTGGDDPSEKMGPLYDTPTLLGTYRTAPYLHHGKAKTLQDVLTTYNRGDRHGKTSHLNKQEIDDLVTFLQSLPYETPPSTTPNSVPYRVHK